MTKIILVTVCFLIGLLLAYLYRGRWARRHLRLLKEQDSLKRQWDSINDRSSTSSASVKVEKNPSSITAMTVGGAAAAAGVGVASKLLTTEEIEPVPSVNTESTDTAERNPDTDLESPRTPVVTEPVSLSVEEPSLKVETEESAPKTLPVDAPVPVISLEDEAPLESPESPVAEVSGHKNGANLTSTTAPSPEHNDDSRTTAKLFSDATQDSTESESPTDTAAKESGDASIESVPETTSPAPTPVAAQMSTPLSTAPSEPSEQTKPLIVNIPSDADPLHLLTGLNPAAANALVTLGITRFEQIYSMDDKELEQLASKHSSLEPLRWREVRDEIRIDSRMRSNPVIPPTAATREVEKPRARTQTTPTATVEKNALDSPTHPSGSTKAESPAEKVSPSSDALTALDGIDAVAARQLNEAGIYRYEDVANLKASDFDEIALRFMGLRKFSWPFWQDKLKKQASTLAGISLPEEEKLPVSDSKKSDTSPVKERIAHASEKISDTKEKVKHITQEAKQVVEGGIDQVKASLEEAKNLATRTTKDSGSIAAKAGHAISGTAMQMTDLIKAEFQDEDVIADLQLGVLYKKAPEHPDDLTKVEGIDSNAAKALHSAGIFTFRQLAHLSDTAPSALAGRSALLAEIDWSAARESAKKLKGHPVKDAISKAAEDIKDGAAEIAAETKEAASKFADTVTDPVKRQAAVDKGKEEIKEVTGKVKDVVEKATSSAKEAAEDLKERALQVKEDWKAEEAKAIQETSQSSKEEAPPETPDADSPPAAGHERKLSLSTKVKHLGDFVEARVYGDHAETDEQSGFRYKSPPFDADDLTKLPGLEGGHAGFLNALGIYKIRQVSKWSDANIHAIAKEEPLLKEHDLRLWRAEARVKAPRSGFRNAWNRISDTARSTVRFYLKDVPRGFEGEEVEMSPYGAVYQARPPHSDPLQQITGISPELATQLNRIGVYRFKQIAGWSTLIRRNVAERLELPAVTQVDNWVEQAQRLTD